MRARHVLAALCMLGALSSPLQHDVGAVPSVLGPPDGFGGNVTGGDDGQQRTVTSLADHGPGTLRAALETPGPAWIQFQVSGRIPLTRPIAVTSDKTIDGRGADITITGDGLRIANATNIAITNLTFTAGRGDTTDAISVREGARDIWIDHCQLSDYDDGLVDITRGATNVTVSWNRFTNQDKVMLINAENQPDPTQVTIHHNLFDTTNQRHPRVVGNVEAHAYNNLLRHWTGYGMQAANDATLLSQANVFEADTDKSAIKPGGHIQSRDDLTLNGAVITNDQTTVTLHQPDDYRTTIEPADLHLHQRLTDDTGPAR